MSDGIWSFLQDENNRALLGWIGGGIVVVAGALWAVVKFFFSKSSEKSQPPPAVSATQGGVAVGRDALNNEINTGGRTKR